MNNRHKVFISFHSVDINYKERFERLFVNHHEIMVSRSVDEGDIGDGLRTETVRQKIRDEYLRDSSVTIVLIGKETWQRKHVDWEISASIRQTQFNPRSGLLGILLPTHSAFGGANYNGYTIPPRLYDNVNNGFAKVYNWNENPVFVHQWIHDAFERRNLITPDNSYPSFVYNRSGERWY